MKITLDVQVIGPLVNEDGKLIVKFIVCGESFEREVEYSEKEGGFIFVETEK